MKWVAGLVLALMIGACVGAQSVSATSSAVVQVTVQPAICGNRIQETGEDCDNQDLQAASCQSLGFQSGTLHCDMACQFDTRDCVALVTNATALSSSSSPTALSALVAKQEQVAPSIMVTTQENNTASIPAEKVSLTDVQSVVSLPPPASPPPLPSPSPVPTTTPIQEAALLCPLDATSTNEARPVLQEQTPNAAAVSEPMVATAIRKPPD